MPDEQKRLYEPINPNTQIIGKFWIGLASFIVLSALVVAGLFWLMGSEPYSQRGEPYVLPVDLPEANPPAMVARQRAEEHQILTTYGWVDRKKGIVRIPIERAIDRVLEKGLPAREGPRK